MADFTRFRLDGADGKVLDIPIASFNPSIDRRVLAFDQTLTHCGWIVFGAYRDEKPHWADCEVIEPGIEVQTMEGRFQAAFAIQLGAAEIMRLYSNVDLIVLESPMIPRPGVHYSDSSLLAASAVYAAARTELPGVELRIVEATSTKARWTGHPHASKAMVRESIKQRFPEITALPRLTEHIYDAAAVGLMGAEAIAVKESSSSIDAHG